jgi:hypothetical protein
MTDDASPAPREPNESSVEAPFPVEAQNAEEYEVAEVNAQADSTERRPAWARMDGFSPEYVNTKTWPDGSDEALERWKQGDLVVDVRPLWLAALGQDRITGVLREGGDDPGPVFLADEPMTAVICSQTCDIGAGPPGDQHPFVLVAPLFHESALSKSRVNLAEKKRLGYLVPVLPPDHEDAPDGTAPIRVGDVSPRGNRWFADLRLLMPLSKTILLTREPRPGFVTERESLEFGEILAQKFRRAALSEALSERLPEALTDYVKGHGATLPAFTKVEQIRLLILDGDRLHPTRAQLLVLTDGTRLDEDERQVWSGFQHRAAALFSRNGIVTGALIHDDVNVLSAAKYRASVPVRCDQIGIVAWP